MCEDAYCGKKQKQVNGIIFYVIQVSFETHLQTACNHAIIRLHYMHIYNLIIHDITGLKIKFFVNSCLLDGKFLCVIISEYLFPHVFSRRLR